MGLAGEAESFLQASIFRFFANCTYQNGISLRDIGILIQMRGFEWV